ncbi:MAG: hypothetical protein K8T90_20785 [Planctomycetes bacterium]|nr:hypothetical protein [Planctomycetota bacterium]
MQTSRRRSALLGLPLALLSACGRADPGDVPPITARPDAAPTTGEHASEREGSTVPSPAATPGRPAGEIPEASRAPRDPSPRPSDPNADHPNAVGPNADVPKTDDPNASKSKPTASEPSAPKEPAAPPVPPAPVKPPRAPIAPGVQEAIDSARAKIAEGLASEAISDLRAAEEKLGTSADLRIAQGRAFLALAELGLARSEDGFLVKGLVADAHMRWKQATAIDADVPGGAVLRARILRFEENPAGAKEVLERRLREFPDDGEAHAILGEMATAVRNWEQADVHWTRAAALDPSDGRARLQATIAKQWLRVPSDQIEAGYVAAAALLPDDAEPVRLLAAIYPKEREKKLAALQKVIDGNPKAVWAYLWTAHVVRTEGTPDTKRAKEVLDAAVKVAPKHPAVHYNLGLLADQAGATTDAVREFTACVENSAEGDCREASDALDRLLNDPAAGSGKDVPLSVRVRAYDAAVAKNPGDGRYGNNAGLWYRDVGRDYEQSLRYYLASVNASPNEQDYVNDCALIYLFHLTDRKELSLPMFDRVLALVDDDGQEPGRGYWDTLENLCKYWFEKGDWAKVVAFAKKRADPTAKAYGNPYPSLRAAQYGNAAQKKLDDAKKGGK